MSTNAQWAGTTSVDFSLAQLVQVIVLLATGGLNGGGYMASKYVVLAIYGAILVIHGLMNSLPIQYLAWFGHLGAFWNTAGINTIYPSQVLNEYTEYICSINSLIHVTLLPYW
jgi:hypothetical protein